MTDVARPSAPAGRTVLFAATILAVIGALLPIYAAVPGVVATIVAFLGLRRLQRAGLSPTMAVMALIIGLGTLGFGVLWFTATFLVSGPAVFDARSP